VISGQQHRRRCSLQDTGIDNPPHPRRARVLTNALRGTMKFGLLRLQAVFNRRERGGRREKPSKRQSRCQKIKKISALSASSAVQSFLLGPLSCSF